MGTKTISLADDAYERLLAAKREGESFSDVVRRLTSGATLSDYHGALSIETVTEIEQSIHDRREDHRTSRTERRSRHWLEDNDS